MPYLNDQVWSQAIVMSCSNAAANDELSFADKRSMISEAMESSTVK